MSYVKNGLFLLICFLAGIGIARAVMYYLHKPSFEQHKEVVQTGVGDAPAVRGFTLDGARLPGGETLAKLCDQWHAVHATALGVTCAESLSRAALAAAAKTAHGHGMKVVLLPPAGVAGGTTNPYPRGLAEVAADAQAAEVDALCVSWLTATPDTAYWKQALAEVRAAYTGPVILAATGDVLLGLEFLDSADVLGVIGPMDLPQRLPGASDSFDLEDVRSAWSCDLTALESLARGHGKKLALLNMRVPASVSLSLDEGGAASQSAGSAPSTKAAGTGPAHEPSLQLLVYEGLLVETKGRAATTQYLLLPWDGADGVKSVAGLSAKVSQWWDPASKKTELTGLPAAFEDLDNPDAGGGGGGGEDEAIGMGTSTGEGNGR